MRDCDFTWCSKIARCSFNEANEREILEATHEAVIIVHPNVDKIGVSSPSRRWRIQPGWPGVAFHP